MVVGRNRQPPFHRAGALNGEVLAEPQQNVLGIPGTHFLEAVLSSRSAGQSNWNAQLLTQLLTRSFLETHYEVSYIILVLSNTTEEAGAHRVYN